jgi:hypothetical protein
MAHKFRLKYLGACYDVINRAIIGGIGVWERIQSGFVKP